eukprot:418978_1
MEVALKLINNLIDMFDIDDSNSHTRHEICMELELDWCIERHTPTIEQYLCNHHNTMKEYLESDDKQPLLLAIKFTQKIDLHSLRIHAVRESRYGTYRLDKSAVSSPKIINIYKVPDVHCSHDDIQCLRPYISILFTQHSKEANAGQKVTLQNLFKETECVAICVESNQNGTERTFVNGITFYGHVSDPNNAHMSQFAAQSQISLVNMETVHYRMSCEYLLDQIELAHTTDPCDPLIELSHTTDSCDPLIPNNHSMDLCNGTLSDCMALQRIIDILASYNVSDVVRVLNDFNHLLFHHNTEFESIYDSILLQLNDRTKCELSDCVIMKRSCRDIMKSNDDYEDFIIQQLLDRIHCYYLHSFDSGYRLSTAEKLRIITEETKSDECVGNGSYDPMIRKICDSIQQKQSIYRNVRELERINANNKFVSDAMQGHMSADNEYVFGYRYFYWKYYEGNMSEYDDAHPMSNMNLSFEMRPPANDGTPVGYWYIPKKYNDLKQELLSNAICTLEATGFAHLVMKAEFHILTDKCKSMRCLQAQSAKIFGMKRYNTITKNHLIAMMAYCNYDVLQNQFSQTFRHLSNETDASLIQRHRNYHHLGRLLREFVECFGDAFGTDSSSVVNVYHGLNKAFTFATMTAYIKGPLSTTKDFTVAINFSCQIEGIILNLQISNNQCAGVQCHWLSNYPNEQEIFFIGGLFRFEFRNIFEVATGTNYQLYISGLKELGKCATIDGISDYQMLSDPDRIDTQMIFRLLSHEIHRHFPNHRYAHKFDLPSYFEGIMQSHCANIRSIVFYNDDKKHVFETLFSDENGWFDIELLMTVFPGLNRIRFLTAMSKCAEQIKREKVYRSVLSYLKHNHCTSHLELVSIEIGLFFGLEMAHYITKYECEFAKYGWNIYMVSKRCGAFICMSTMEHSQTEQISTVLDFYLEDMALSTDDCGAVDIKPTKPTKPTKRELLVRGFIHENHGTDIDEEIFIFIKRFAQIVESTILSYEEQIYLTELIERQSQTKQFKDCEWNLLCSGTRDGMKQKIFHDYCDNQPHTVCILNVSSSGYVCGGYASTEWQSTDDNIAAKDDNTFLFVLRPIHARNVFHRKRNEDGTLACSNGILYNKGDGFNFGYNTLFWGNGVTNPEDVYCEGTQDYFDYETAKDIVGSDWTETFTDFEVFTFNCK